MDEDSLEYLRIAVRETDRQIVQSLARRLELARRIGEAKTKRGQALRDFATEKQVVGRMRSHCEEAGIDPRLGEAIARRLIQGAVKAQEDLRALQPVATSRDVVVIGGHGRMGRWIAHFFGNQGHRVSVVDVDEADSDYPSVPLSACAGSDVVILATPLIESGAILSDVVALEPRGLVFDVASLKTPLRDSLEDARSKGLKITSLHPMFGPSVHALRRQKVVVCPVREGPTGRWLLGELGALGLELIEADADEHDHLMAVVQVLVHFTTLVMGDALRRSGVGLERSLEVTSPIYRLELAFVGRLFAQDAGLYAEIEMANPRGEAIRRLVRDVVDDWTACIESGDREAFAERFEAVRAWFSGFSGEAMTLSDRIIDLLVREP